MNGPPERIFVGVQCSHLSLDLTNIDIDRCGGTIQNEVDGDGYLGFVPPIATSKKYESVQLRFHAGNRGGSLLHRVPRRICTAKSAQKSGRIFERFAGFDVVKRSNAPQEKLTMRFAHVTQALQRNAAISSAPQRTNRDFAFADLTFRIFVHEANSQPDEFAQIDFFERRWIGCRFGWVFVRKSCFHARRADVVFVPRIERITQNDFGKTRICHEAPPLL